MTAHTVEIDRDKTARRLLGSSSRNSYDPLLDIDWAAPLGDEHTFLPPERVSLYGTELWEQLTPEQRRELSKHELASIASTGLWFELILIQMLTRYAYHRDPRAAHIQYALTEIGDETRHVIMFAKLIERLAVPRYQPPRYVHHLARWYKATARGPMLFAPVLVAEEVTDRLQRASMNDDSIHPLVRMVNRIHVVEEARHVRFAREELARVVARMGRLGRAWHRLNAAVVSAFVVNSLIDPQVYASVGLDPKAAARIARANPHHQQTRRWMAEKIMRFLADNDMVGTVSGRIYRWAHLL